MTVSPFVMTLIHLCASFVFALSLKHIVWFEVVQWWKRQQQEALSISTSTANKQTSKQKERN